MWFIVLGLLTDAPKDLRYYWKYEYSLGDARRNSQVFDSDRMRSYADLAVIVVTLVGTMLYNIEVGVVGSIILSLLLVVHKSSKPRLTILVSPFLTYCPTCCPHSVYPQGRVPGTNDWKSLEDDGVQKLEDIPGVLNVLVKDDLDFSKSSFNQSSISLARHEVIDILHAQQIQPN